MNSIHRPNVRSAEVYRLLLTHQALSSGALLSLMKAPISRRRLRDVLARLTKARIVSRRFDRIFGGHGVFYEIAEPHRSNAGVATVHSSGLLHNDFCSLTHAKLQEAFPSAKIFRDYLIGKIAELRDVMKYRFDAPDSLPDLLLVLPTSHNQRSVYIAVEIERSAKSKSRLLRKFSKYAARSKLDGVLYLSEDQALLAILRDFYQTKISNTARRIGHYKNNFFMTAPCLSKHHLEIKNLLNSANIPVSLGAWTRELIKTPLLYRRDDAFLESTLSGVVQSEAAS